MLQAEESSQGFYRVPQVNLFVSNLLSKFCQKINQKHWFMFENNSEISSKDKIFFSLSC